MGQEEGLKGRAESEFSPSSHLHFKRVTRGTDAGEMLCRSAFFRASSGSEFQRLILHQMQPHTQKGSHPPLVLNLPLFPISDR